MRHEIIDHVAEKMHVRKSTLQRFLQGKAGLLERWGTDEASLALFKVEEILELAAKGNVIIRGWGATHVLHPIPHIPCVRVGAPFATRVKWLMTCLGTDDEEMASEEIRHSDAAHRANMQHQFGVTWGEAMQYDLTLNTERLSVATCVEQIKQLLKRPEFAETPASHAKLTNLTLEYHVRAALRAHAKTADVKIAISADNGKVTLDGHRGQRRRAPRHRRGGIACRRGEGRGQQAQGHEGRQAFPFVQDLGIRWCSSQLLQKP